MKRKLLALWLGVVVLLFTAVSAQADSQYIEDSIHVPMDTSATVHPNNVFQANDHGCDDYWAQFNSGLALPTGVWADNTANQAHIGDNNGLDGYFICYTSNCVTYLCTKHGFPFDAWSVQVKY